MYIIDLDTIISEQFAWYVLHLVCNNMCSLLFENQVKVIIYKIKADYIKKKKITFNIGRLG